MWDLESGQVLKTLEHSGILGVAVTPDGCRAISGSSDNTIIVWDLESGNAIAAFEGEGFISACAFGLNGAIIIAGESSGRLHFLKLENA